MKEVLAILLTAGDVPETESLKLCLTSTAMFRLDESLVMIRRGKVRNLHEIVRAVRDANLILVCGTERNKHGLPFVDELDSEYLAPIAEAVREGALALYGHTALARFAGRPLGGEWARAAFGDDASRNRFFAEVGRLLEPGPGADEKVKTACEATEPEAVLATLRAP